MTTVHLVLAFYGLIVLDTLSDAPSMNPWFQLHARDLGLSSFLEEFLLG